jgi:hypothetical protein
LAKLVPPLCTAIDLKVTTIPIAYGNQNLTVSRYEAGKGSTGALSRPESRDNLPLAINAVCIMKRYEICILTTQWPVDPITEPADDCPIAKV